MFIGKKRKETYVKMAERDKILISFVREFTQLEETIARKITILELDTDAVVFNETISMIEDCENMLEKEIITTIEGNNAAVLEYKHKMEKVLRAFKHRIQLILYGAKIKTK